jgi:hypothetical protein
MGSALELEPWGRFLKNVLIFEKNGGCWPSEHFLGVRWPIQYVCLNLVPGQYSTVELDNWYLDKINYKILPFKIGSLATHFCHLIKYLQKIKMKSIFERELAIWNYLHLAIKNITKFTLYFAIFLKKILGKNEESIGAESWSGTLWLLFLSWIIKNQNSGFVRA